MTAPLNSPPSTGPLQGRALGDYRILREIGRGSFGVVYLAIDSAHDDRQVALKFLPPTLARNRSVVSNFVREGQIAAGLKHPNIVPVYAVQTGQYTYIALQYIDGMTLADRLKLGALSPTQAVGVISAVANALEAAHLKGFLHGDVKPSNILIEDTTGHVYLTDFGLARARNTLGLASSQGLAGTLAYISPEQAREEPLDERADVYALGVVAYETLTGHRPFIADTVFGYVRQHSSIPPPPPSRYNPNLSPETEAVLLKALSKSPADRYATAPEFAQALAASLNPTTAGQVMSAAAPARLPEFKPPPNRAPPYILLFTLLGLSLALAYLALLVLHPPTFEQWFGRQPALVAFTASPTLSPTPTETPTPTASATPTLRPTATPTAGITPSATASPTALPPTPISSFSDTFSGAALSPIWTVVSGQPQVVSGALQLADESPALQLRLSNAFYQSVRIEATVSNLSSTPDQFLAPQSAAIALIAYQQSDGSAVGLVAEQNALQFARLHPDGSWQLLNGSRVTTDLDLSAPAQIVFQAVGPLLHAFYNGTLVSQASYSGPTFGSVGLALYPAENSAQISTLQIATLPNPPASQAPVFDQPQPFSDSFGGLLRPEWVAEQGTWGVVNEGLTLTHLTPGRSSIGVLGLGSGLNWEELTIRLQVDSLFSFSDSVFLFEGNSAVGVLVRRQPDGSGVGLVIERQSLAFATYSPIGGWQLLPDTRVAYSVEDDSFPEFRITVQGSQLQAFVNDELLTSTRYSGPASGSVALYLRSTLPINPASPNLTPRILNFAITP